MTDSLFTGRSKQLMRGFSLIEMMVVITIMGILAVALIRTANSYVKSTRKRAAKTMLRTIGMGINQYHADMNSYPETLQDLITQPNDAKNWNGRYIERKTLPKDPWGQQYIYEVTPDAENPYELYSRGPNKKAAKKSEYLSVWDEE